MINFICVTSTATFARPFPVADCNATGSPLLP